MSESWLLKVYDDQLLSAVKECGSPLELGRQDERAGEGLYQVSHLADGHYRVAIARGDELKISRRVAWLECAAGGRVLVRNQSANVTFNLEAGGLLKPGSAAEVELPVVLTFGKKVVRIQSAIQIEPSQAIQSLDAPTDFALGTAERQAVFTSIDLHATAAPDVEGLIGWLAAMIRVLQSAACDADFFQHAANAVVEVVRLDQGRVLAPDGDGGWKTVASSQGSASSAEQQEPPSKLVINRVCERKTTTWFDPLQLPEDCSSLAGVSSVVAAPVLDRSGQVIAILYGERRLDSLIKAARPVSRLDAKLVEVLAVGLSTGLARVKEEGATLALQTQFGQFFTPELARHLLTRPDLLNGQDLEITALFCDIRGFSRITRNHEPAFTLEWINDVLSTLSDCALKHRGVLVDYIGDELLAMWGAPEAQPDHAAQACRAALDMIASMSDLNARWQERLGEPMAVGIGINTGMARVGNTGSSRKFKYGPLGDTVNVASRVQGSSKYFKANLLLTKATRDRLGPEFHVRRLGKTRVINIASPIELYELWPPSEPGAVEFCSAYEEALAAFEAGEFRAAARILGRLVNSRPDDGPSFALLARAIACIVEEPEKFDPAFRLPGK